MNTRQWDVTKYGEMIDRSDIEVKGIGIITTKVYKYNEKYFVEVWDSGCCVHFSEVID